MAVCKLAEHLGDLVPSADLLVLLVCLEERVLEHFLPLGLIDGAAVGVGGLRGHLLGGVGIPFEGKHLGRHHLPQSILEPFVATLDHLVVFGRGHVAEGDAISGVPRKITLWILLHVLVESIEGVRIITQLEVAEGDAVSALLGEFPVGEFLEVFFVVLDRLLVLVPLGGIASLCKLTVGQEELHVGSQGGCVPLLHQRPEYGLGFRIIAGFEGDSPLQITCLRRVLTRGKLRKVLVEGGHGVVRPAEGAIGRADTEEAVLAHFRILGGLEDTFPDQDRLPFLVKLVVGLCLADPDRNLGVRELLEISKHLGKLIDLGPKRRVRRIHLHEGLGIGLQARLVVGDLLLHRGNALLLEIDHHLLGTDDRVHLERFLTLSLGQQSVPDAHGEDVQLEGVVHD